MRNNRLIIHHDMSKTISGVYNTQIKEKESYRVNKLESAKRIVQSRNDYIIISAVFKDKTGKQFILK